MKKWFGVSLGILLCILVLELLPWGVAMRWGSPDPTRQPVSYYPYFHPLPYGYGNFGPFLTALLTSLLLIFSIVFLCFKKPGFRWLTMLHILTAVAFLTSLMPLVMLGQFTVIGGFISALLIVLLTVQLLTRQAMYREREENN